MKRGIYLLKSFDVHLSIRRLQINAGRVSEMKFNGKDASGQLDASEKFGLGYHFSPFLPVIPSVNFENMPCLPGAPLTSAGVSCSGAGPGSSGLEVTGGGACATSPRDSSASASGSAGP